MPLDVMDKYRDIFSQKVSTTIAAVVNSQQRNFGTFDKLISSGAALPENLDMKNLMLTKRTMNTLMKSYVDRIRASPATYIKTKGLADRLCKANPTTSGNPTFYSDSLYPSFINGMLYGLEFDFLILNCLIIIAMDRAKYLVWSDGSR